MNLATAYVTIRPKTDTFARETDEAATKAGRSAAAKFATVFGAAAFGAAMKKSIDAASDLNETVSKTGVVFGESAKDIMAWADNAAKEMGMSKRAAMDAAAGFAILGKSAGLTGGDLTAFSTDLSVLAGDLASFSNSTPEEAIIALSAALRGESEPIRRYGVLLNVATLENRAVAMGIAEVGAQLTMQQRVLAAQAEIMAQTTVQQGDFARTADGAANSQRTATAAAEDSAASLGQNFLPVYTQVVKIVGALATAFGALPGPLQTAIVALIAITVLAGPITAVAGGISAINEAIVNLSPAMRALGASMGAVGALLAIGSIAYSIYAGKKKQAEARTKDLASALREEGAAQNEALKALAANDKGVRKFIETSLDLGYTMDQVNQFVTAGTGPVGNLADAYANAKAETGDLKTQLYEMASALGPVAGSVEEWFSTLDGTTIKAMIGQKDFLDQVLDLRDGQLEMNDVNKLVAQSTGEVAGATDEAVDPAKALAAADEALTKANDDLKAALDPVRYAMDEAADAADALSAAIDRVFGGSIGVEEATRNLQAAADDLTTSFSENGKSMDVATAEGRANREAIQAQVEGILDYGVALVNSGQSAGEAATAVGFLTDGLKAQLEEAGLTESQIDDYLTTLGMTPENVWTTIELANEDVAKTQLGAMLDQLGEIEEGAAAEIEALINQGKFREAEQRIRDIDAKNPQVSVDLIPGKGLTLSPSVGGGGSQGLKFMAAGGYLAPRKGGYLANLAEAGEAEAVLPLERPGRLAELVGDPRIGGPIAEAMGGRVAGAAQAGVDLVALAEMIADKMKPNVNIEQVFHEKVDAEAMSSKLAWRLTS